MTETPHLLNLWEKILKRSLDSVRRELDQAHQKCRDLENQIAQLKENSSSREDITNLLRIIKDLKDQTQSLKDTVTHHINTEEVTTSIQREAARKRLKALMWVTGTLLSVISVTTAVVAAVRSSNSS